MKGYAETTKLQRIFFITVLGLVPAMGGEVSMCVAVADESRTSQLATLGAKTRAPTAEEAKTYNLRRAKGRPAGQLVTSVDKKGPADKAGLAEGDVLLSLDSNELYSRDDLEDFLRASKPAAKVRAMLKRADTFAEESVTIALGRSVGATANGRFAWQYAGLGQLDRALADARKDKKLLLVGLSGAET